MADEWEGVSEELPVPISAEADDLAPSSGTGLPEEVDLGRRLDALQADLRAGLVALGQRLTRLESHFETKLMYDDSKDRTIDALHRELQDYREDLQFKHLRPLVADFLILYDDLTGLLASFRADQPDAAEVEPTRTLLNSLDLLCDDMAAALEKYGFEFFTHEGPEIDRGLQRVQGTVPTDQAALDRTVAVRLRRGLRYEERIIRPEVVQAYQMVKPAE